MAATLGASAATTVLPAAIDRPVTAALHHGSVRFRPDRVQRYAERVRRVLETPSRPVGPQRAREISLAYMRMRIEVRWLRARGAGARPGRVPTVVEGYEHVEDAIAAGRGVVLWRMSTTSPAVANAAFADRGRPLVHLSSTEHMLGRPPLLSMRWWGALNTRAEARWLAERIVIPAGGSLGYLPRLRQVLAAGGVVSIVGDLTSGRSTIDHRIGNLDFALPTGAPSLAHATGAALLPCATVRTGPLSYRVVIHPDVADHTAPDRRSFRRSAVAAYGQRIEQLAHDHPESWTFWGRAD